MVFPAESARSHLLECSEPEQLVSLLPMLLGALEGGFTGWARLRGGFRALYRAQLKY